MSNDLYWEFENNNRFSKSEYSFEEAEKLNRTLVNCSNCENCSFCFDCVNCSWCIDKESVKDIHNPSWR